MTDFLLPGEEGRMQRAASPSEPTFLLPGETLAEDRARQNIGILGTSNPDKVAEARRLSTATGIPTNVIGRNPDRAQIEARLREIDGLMKETPALAKAYADPSFAEIAHDDGPALAVVAKQVAPPKPVVTNTEFGDLVRKVKKENPALDWDNARTIVLARVSGIIADDEPRMGPSTPPAPTAGNLVSGLGVSFVESLEQMRQGLRRMFADAAGFEEMGADAALKGLRSQNRQFLGVPQPEGDLGHVYGGVQSTLQTAPALAVGLASGGAGLALMGLQQGLPAYSKYRDRGGSGGEAFTGAAIEGIAEAGLEKLPMDFFVKKFGRAGFGEFLAGTLAREVPTEIATTIVQSATDTAIANPNKTWGQWVSELPAELRQTVIATLTQSAIMGGVGAGVKRIGMRDPIEEQAQRANVAVNNFQALQNVFAAPTLTRDRDPSAYAKFINDAAEEGPVQNLYVDARTLLQSGVDLQPLAQARPELQAEIMAKAATGGDVAIPLGEYTAFVAPQDTGNALLQNLRTSEDGMTQAEAQVFMQSQGEQIKAHTEKLIAEAQEDDARAKDRQAVETAFLDQLNKVNRFTKDVNATYAHMIGAISSVMAMRMARSGKPEYQGMTAQKFAQTYGLIATAEQVAGQNALNEGPMLAHASDADFAPGNLKNILQRGRWVVMTAENPNAQQLSPEENAARMEQLKARLDEKGWRYTEVKGKYGNEENSLLVLGPTSKEALELGTEFGQESVLTRHGLLYRDGTANPATGVEEFDTPPEDFFSTIPSTGSRFSVQLDFDKRVPVDLANAETYEQRAKVGLPDDKLPPGKAVPASVYLVASIMQSHELAKGAKFKTNRDFKVEMQKRVLAAAKAAKVDLSADTAATREYLTNAMIAEAREALRTNPGAVGWYDDKVTTALEVVSLIHPEIKTDPQAKFAFIWALAVTSNGMKVNKNFELAEKAYQGWKATGEMPEVGEGPTKSKINDGLALYNILHKRMGFEALQAFMLKLDTVKGIDAAVGIEPSGEAKSQTLFGAAILGPKIGNGFFMNLFGEFGQLTMDRWFVRTWGRLTGQLIVEQPEVVREQTAAMKEMLKVFLAPENKAARKTIEQAIGMKLSLGKALDIAKAIQKAGTKKEFRDAMAETLPMTPELDALVTQLRGPVKKNQKRAAFGDELRKMANTLARTADGQKESPSGAGERRLMRVVMSRALTELQKENPDLTMADLQALVWYPEKKLYESASDEVDEGEEGYEDDEAPDYANAAIKLAREQGVPEDQIAGAVERARADVALRKQSAAVGRGAGDLRQGDGPTFQQGGIDGTRSGVQQSAAQQVLGTTLSGEPPAEGWAGATRIRRADGTPLLVHRGAAEPLGAGHFGLNALGRASGNPSSGLGVWFTTGPGEAGTYGSVESFYLDIRNPKVIKVDQLPGFDSVAEAHAFREKLRAEGYDGIAITGKHLGKQEVHLVAFDPSQVIRGQRTFSQSGLAYAGERQQALNSTPTYGTSRPDGIDVVGVHFSNEARDSLDGSKYGTGMKGAERDSVMNSADPRLKNRVFFYVPEGQGVQAERYVGSQGHVVRLQGLYDAEADPLGIWKKGGESAVLDAGFSGYYSRGAFGKQGTAVVFPKAPIKVQHFGGEGTINSMLGTERAPDGQYTAGRVAANELLQAKDLPSGQMERGRWARMVELVNPALHEKLADLGAFKGDPNERLYRDELVRVFAQSRQQTQTEAFKEWFGDSKVVDANGEPLVVYHGTNADFDTFDPSAEPQTYATDRGKQFFTSSPKDASAYAESATAGANVMPVYLSVQNPRVETTDLDPSDWWDRNGAGVWAFDVEGKHDGLIVKGADGKVLYVTSRPEQIKSATGNDGSFDANDPSIMSQGEQARGQIAFGNDITQTPSIITLLKNADLSTFIHEAGHFYLEVLNHIASQPNAPVDIVEDFDKVLKWFGITGTEAPKGGARGGVVEQAGRKFNAAFKRWFGDSKVVDANGEPLVVYHGSKHSGFQVFDTEGVGKTRGTGAFFVNDNRGASTYSGTSREAEVSSDPDFDPKYEGAPGNYPVYLSIRNPKIIDAEGRNWDSIGAQEEWFAKNEDGDTVEYFTNEEDANHFRDTSDEFIEIEHSLDPSTGASTDDLVREARAEGYDGVIIRNVVDEGPHGQGYGWGDTVYVVFSPEQIKSATGNDGTFDANDPSILSQGGNDGTKSPLPAGQTARDVWNAMSLEEKRPYHEQFARGFEAYAFEGKAPAVGLRKVFQRFAAWMKAVYRSVSNLNVQLDDEIRGVFDRMLASDKEIEQAEAARGYAPVLASKPPSMTDEEWADYQSTGQQATLEASEELTAKALRNMAWLSRTKAKVVAQITKSAREARKAIRREVEDEVRQQPVYAAEYWLKKGILPDGTQTVGAKLDLAALKEMYGEGPAAPWRYLNNLAGNEGMHPDQVAEMFGFRSGDHLVRELLAAESFRSVVDGMTDQRMLERHGEIADPEGVERAAEEAIHNEARAKFLATELQALEDMVNPRVDTGKTATDSRGRVRKITQALLPKAAREFAEAIIGRQKVREIKVSPYEIAEARAGRNANEAMKKGDVQAAAVEKRNQLINFYAVKAARKALEDAEAAVNYLKKFDRKATRESLSPDYLDQIDKLLERFDLRRSTNKELDKRQSLLDWVESQRAAGIEPSIPQELLNEAARTSYRNMTVEELRGLVDTVRQIEHLGRLKSKLLKLADKREFEAVRDQLLEHIESNAKKVTPEIRKSERGILVNARRMFRTAIAVHRKFASMIREMDGYKDGGFAWNLIVKPMNQLGDHEATRLDAENRAMVDLLAPLAAKGQPKMTAKKDYPPAGRSFTREERIGLLLNMGNETNRERIITGERLTEAQLADILADITPEEAEFANKVWAYIDSFWPEVVEKQKRLTGVAPEKVEAVPFVLNLRDGTQVTMRGGYFPIAYDPDLSTKSAADATAEVAKQMERGLYVAAQTRRGHTKARVESTGRKLRLDFGHVMASHVQQVVHDLTWHEYLIDTNRMLKDKAVDAAIREHYGQAVLKELQDTLRDIAIGEAGVERMGPVWNYLRRGTTVALMGLNLFNAVQNLTGFTNSMSRIGTKWALKGAIHWAGDAAHFESSIAKIREKSEFMRMRDKTFDREVNDIRNKITGNTGTASMVLYWFAAKTQVMVDTPTWWGAYEKAMHEVDSEERAVALADQAVRDAQGGGQLFDNSGIMRGGQAMKLLTALGGYFSNVFNLTHEAYTRTDFKKPGEVLAFAADMALLYTIPALLTTLLKATLSGDWDDPEKLKRKLIADQLTYLIGPVMGLREAAAGINAALGQGGGYSGPAGMRLFASIGELGKQASQGEVDAAFLKALNMTAGLLFHYPAAQINKTAEGVAALSDGKTSNPGVLLTGPAK